MLVFELQGALLIMRIDIYNVDLILKTENVEKCYLSILVNKQMK